MNINYQKVGNRIAICRRILNIKQKDLAVTIGISSIYLSNIENGKVMPSLNVFIEICKALDRSPDFFLLGKL